MPFVIFCGTLAGTVAVRHPFHFIPNMLIRYPPTRPGFTIPRPCNEIPVACIVSLAIQLRMCLAISTISFILTVHGLLRSKFAGGVAASGILSILIFEGNSSHAPLNTSPLLIETIKQLVVIVHKLRRRWDQYDKTLSENGITTNVIMRAFAFTLLAVILFVYVFNLKFDLFTFMLMLTPR